MLSFGQARNSLEQLRKYLTKMGLFSSPAAKVTLKDLEEPNFRRAGNELFLPLINFILIEYSPTIYWQIIEIVPSIKVLDDKQFIEQSMGIARKLLEMDVQLTPDQFLTNKYFERKLEFVSKLAKSVFERNEAIKKVKAKNPPNFTAAESTAFDLKGCQNYITEMMDDDDDFEEEVPRTINAIPAKFQMPPEPVIREVPLRDTVPISKQKFKIAGEQFEEEDVVRQLKTRNNVKRPVEQPLKVESWDSSPEEMKRAHGKTQDYGRFRLDPKKNEVQSYPDAEEEEDSVEYVTKEDFKQLLQLVMTTSQTINEISGKFSSFQAKVGAEISNLSARVMLLEGNVKLLKDNL